MRYFILSFALFLEGCCGMWPYKSDFDCKIPSGEYCKSLYQINKKADNGDYEPRNEDENNEELKGKKNKPSYCGGKR